MQAPFPGRSWAESAREIEALGYSTLFVPDHFHQGFGPLTGMTAAALATTTLRVGTLVLACDFRHPAVLARELASIDQFSSGRLEVGLGAGYNPLDYERSGIPMDPAPVRVDRMIEHATVLRRLFASDEVNFDGEHYHIHQLDGTPKPFRPNGPPIIIAGGGKRILRFAAAFADIIGVNPSLKDGRPRSAAAQDSVATRIDEKFSWVRAASGDRFGDIEFNAWISVAEITNDAQAIVGPMSDRFGGGIDDVLASPIVLVGSPGEIAERLHERRERWGYSYIVLPGPKAREFAALVQSLTGT